MVSTWYLQARMVGAIAEIYGHSVKEERVQTIILLCLIGEEAITILRSCGIKIGRKIGEKLIAKIPGKVITAINKKVTFRLITKAGEKGVINLTKCIPISGGAISGGVDRIL